MPDEILGGSFRDPRGFLFERDGVLHRQVNPSGLAGYEHLMESGLYDALREASLLVAHEDVTSETPPSTAGARVLRPERIPFVSYPYEWCFGQLKDAALATLRVLETALRFDATLEDASAYNVQFVGGRPVFIDTLSFAPYEEGRPWTGYRQFCEHFLAPLALMAYRDVRLSQLLRANVDGVPLDLASRLLPARTWLRAGLALNLRVHARYQRRHAADAGAAARARPVSRTALGNLLRSMRATLEKLSWEPGESAWSGYAEGDSYTQVAAAHKRELVAGFLDVARPVSLWDLGANLGEFSRLAAERGIRTVSFDADPACVERGHRQAREVGTRAPLHLLMDLANPSPSLGFAHRERDSLVRRGPADCVLALALVHHLAIGRNVPLPRLARFLARLGPRLVVEFVPKSDPKVGLLLANRADVFPDYTREGFEEAFGRHFSIEEAAAVRDSERTLYRMRRRG